MFKLNELTRETRANASNADRSDLSKLHQSHLFQLFSKTISTKADLPLSAQGAQIQVHVTGSVRIYDTVIILREESASTGSILMSRR